MKSDTQLESLLMVGAWCHAKWAPWICFTVWLRYLLEHGANIAAVNSDGDVPLDIAEADNMETLLRSEIGKRGKD